MNTSDVKGLSYLTNSLLQKEKQIQLVSVPHLKHNTGSSRRQFTGGTMNPWEILKRTCGNFGKQ